ncbi:hypothetical protein F8388_026973 [Cannabis sativa]|uniref:GRF-type domain-containing protein n=1 Tax=Cannabis sativa TaxID=3483 RepID=A0A7J6EDV3_CANSA|nr:hypothetical protein F8388_026973 [Cannabis sativa]
MGRWFCDCKPPLEVAIRTSRTMKNPGRRFKCCPIHKRNGGCNFFEWVDREMFQNCGGGCCIHGDWSRHEVSMGYCSVHQQRTAPCSHGVCTNGDVDTHCSSHHSHAPLEDYNESRSAFERGKDNYWIWFLGCVVIVVLYLDWQMVVSPFSLAEQAAILIIHIITVSSSSTDSSEELLISTTSIPLPLPLLPLLSFPLPMGSDMPTTSETTSASGGNSSITQLDISIIQNHGTISQSSIFGLIQHTKWQFVTYGQHKTFYEHPAHLLLINPIKVINLPTFIFPITKGCEEHAPMVDCKCQVV